MSLYALINLPESTEDIIIHWPRLWKWFNPGSLTILSSGPWCLNFSHRQRSPPCSAMCMTLNICDWVNLIPSNHYQWGVIVRHPSLPIFFFFSLALTLRVRKWQRGAKKILKGNAERKIGTLGNSGCRDVETKVTSKEIELITVFENVIEKCKRRILALRLRSDANLWLSGV